MKTRALVIASVASIISTMAVQVSAQSLPNNVYVRADLGWSGGTGAGIHDITENKLSVNPLSAIVGSGGHPGTLDRVGDAMFGGLGVGMQFTPYLRGDIVYTYRGTYNIDETDFAGTRFKADIWSNSVMANGYLDYPYAGVIPYIGAGIGWADAQVGHFKAITTAVGANPLIFPPHPEAVGSTAVAPGGSSDNFAFQVMVGVGVPISEGVMFDAFYRYFDGGHLRTTAGNVLINNVVAGTYGGVEGALHANELGVSVRFAL